MLYHLLYPLSGFAGIFNVLQYLTFRSMAAFLLSFSIALFCIPRFIVWLRTKQFGQPIRDDGPQSHLSKKGTPTMGGLVVVGSVILTSLLLSRLNNVYVWVLLASTLSYGFLGFQDDFRKIRGNNTKGLSAKQKLLWQTATAVIGVGLMLMFSPGFSTALTIPFLKHATIELGTFWFLVFSALVIVGTSNAVNLTDGLDGLMIGPVMTVALAYGIFAYVTGNVRIADYLLITHINGVGELSIFAASIIGAGLGFLWFNSYPAQIFMGDTGSLALGGALGILAVMTKQELALLISGALFVVEALSVIAQVTSFKLFGKRVLKMAPIHHHYELSGVPEPKIIVRFWILSIVLALIALATLKLR